MAETAIEWSEFSWNPTRGCARVSPGCEHCYAERQAHRHNHPKGAYVGLTVLGKHGPRWNGRAIFVPEKLGEPLRWKKPRRIFVNSMSDLFHEDITDEQIEAVFGAMSACPQHTFQVLTKRPERAVQWFKSLQIIGRPYPPSGECYRSFCDHIRHPGRIFDSVANWPGPVDWPLRNVHFGVSCEDQERADIRVPLLLQCPAAVRWVSLEPLLGQIDLRKINGSFDALAQGRLAPAALDWVVVGGESGPGARPCDVEWIRSIVAQCSAMQVPVFVKQLGAKWTENRGHHAELIGGLCKTPFVDGARITDDGTVERTLIPTNRKGGDPSEWPEDLRVRQLYEAAP